MPRTETSSIPQSAALTCALCGSTNHCGIAAGASTCWCFHTHIPPATLARVRAGTDSQTCICERCATEPSGGETPSDNDESRD